MNIKYHDFQETVWTQPIVHAYLERYMRAESGSITYIETLKQIIVDLSKKNDYLENKLVDLIKKLVSHDCKKGGVT